MTSDRQITANRRNAQKSTGPKTDAGKKQASANAYRHGLASRRPAGETASAQEIEQLACMIAGGRNNPTVLEWAHTAVEATRDLARVRRTRVALIDQTAGGELPHDYLLLVVKNLLKHNRLQSRALKRPGTPLRTLEEDGVIFKMPSEEPDRTAEAVRRLLPELRILDRYERRALARRDKAFRKVSVCLLIQATQPARNL